MQLSPLCLLHPTALSDKPRAGVFVLLSPMFSELVLESDRKTFKYFSLLLIYVLGRNVFKYRQKRLYISTAPLDIAGKAFSERILLMNSNNLHYVSILKVGC